MTTLVIDTGHARCQSGLALADGSTLSLAEDRARGHAEVLIGQVETLLATAGLGFPDLVRIGVTTGPGSFTGIRVGLAAARAFGLALAVPVLGIPTLLALSLGAPAGAPVTVIVDARRGEAFVQSFTGPGAPAAPPRALPLEQALVGIEPKSSVIGSAAAMAVRERGAVELESGLPAGRRGFVDVERLALFARTADPARFPSDPVYIRSPDARPQTARLARK